MAMKANRMCLPQKSPESLLLSDYLAEVNLWLCIFLVDTVTLFPVALCSCQGAGGVCGQLAVNTLMLLHPSHHLLHTWPLWVSAEDRLDTQ